VTTVCNAVSLPITAMRTIRGGGGWEGVDGCWWLALLRLVFAFESCTGMPKLGVGGNLLLRRFDGGE
jgi:hypothetical protein